MAPANATRARFGQFEFDLRTGELHGPDGTILLRRQISDLLQILVEHAPDLATYEEIEEKLWPNVDFAEFDVAIRAATMRLRDALGDSAEEQKYIETLKSRGYRLACPVEWLPSAPEKGKEEGEADVQPDDEGGREKSSWRDWLSQHRRTVQIALVASAMLLLCLIVTMRYGSSYLARYYNNRGMQRQARANMRDAMADYQRAIEINPRYAPAHYNLADADEEIGMYDKSVKEYQLAIQEDPEFYEAYNNLARLYIKRFSDSGAAVALIEHALAMRPNEPAVRYSLYKNYGWASLNLNLPEQAEHELRLAISIDPTYGAAHCLLAKVLDAKGQPADAQAEWELCVAYASKGGVEPEWRLEGQERLEVQR